MEHSLHGLKTIPESPWGRQRRETGACKSHCKSETAEQGQCLLLKMKSSPSSLLLPEVLSLVCTAMHKETPVNASADVLKVDYNSCQ